MKTNTNNSFEILEWDSEHFGFSVAKLNLTHASILDVKLVLKKAKAKEVKLAYLGLSPGQLSLNNIATKCNGVLVDQKIIFDMDISRKMINDYPENISSIFGQKLTSKLKKLAYEAGGHSRFRIDKNFDLKIFKHIYSEWIRKSLSGQDYVAQEVFANKTNGIINGFITLVDRGDQTNIGLIAVDPKRRGLGIGRDLVIAGIVWSQKRGLGKMSVVTQLANRGACQFYEKIGFKEKSIENIYHFWL